jgi:hypothetical protein
MDLDFQLFWSGVYFIGLFLLWLSFYLLTGPVKNLEYASKRKTHSYYILVALFFLMVRPLVNAYSSNYSNGPLDPLVELASVLSILVGSLLVFIPISSLAKRALTDSIGNGTWIFYLQASIVAFYFAYQTPIGNNGLASGIYMAAALLLGLSLRLISNFTEQFEIMFPLRWMFDTAAWMLPLALAIRAYGVSVSARFSDAAFSGYVSGEIRIIFIFLIFISGLISFISAYMLNRAFLTQPAKI